MTFAEATPTFLKHTCINSNQFQSIFFGGANEGSAGIMINHIIDEANCIYLALYTTDFRKQQNGLASLVSLKFNLDPYSGTDFLMVRSLTFIFEYNFKYKKGSHC